MTKQRIRKDISMKHIARQRRPVRAAALGIAAMAAVMAAGCSSSTNPTAAHESSSSASAPAATSAPTPAAAHGGDVTIKDVPWSKVGPGWVLATWSPVTPHRPGEQRAPGEPNPETADTTLYLVDPAGNRYAITTFSGANARLSLVDWSGDGSRALFANSYPTPSKVISVDLHTGEQTTIPVHGYPHYTRPDGKAIRVWTSYNGNEPGTLKRLDLAGNEQVSYPTEHLGGAGQFSGDYLESPDGTQLVLATANLGNGLVPRTDNSLVVMGNDGSIIRTLPAPMANAVCSPVRWWTPTVILAHCTRERSSATQLWEVPIDGGTPTALTAVNSGQHDDPGFGGDIDDGIAWQLPSGTFLQSAGACGTSFLSRLTPDGHTTRVTVPDVSDSVLVTGATGDSLVLQGKVGCGGTRSLLTYHPATNTSTVLLGPPVNGGGVKDAILYREAN
jgi:TolB protein